MPFAAQTLVRTTQGRLTLGIRLRFANASGAIAVANSKRVAQAETLAHTFAVVLRA